MTFALFVQAILGGLTIGGAYCLIGYGFVLCWRVAKVINLAQVNSGLFGGFVCLWLTHLKFPLFVGIIAGILASGLLGFLTDRLIINPLRRSKIIAWLIGGLAVHLLIRQTIIYWWGCDSFWFPSLLGKRELTIAIGNAFISLDRLLLIVVAFLIVYILELVFDYTMLGKMMRATAHDEVAAALMGINTNMVVMSTLILSSVLCAIGIILQAPFTNLTSVMGFDIMIKGLIAAIVGGLDSRRGVAVAALVLGILESFGGILTPAGYRDAFTFGMLILMLLTRPQGLFGKFIVREV